MGIGDPGEGRERVELPEYESLDICEEKVLDYLLTDATDDPHVKTAVHLALAEIRSGRPLYPNLRDEPVLFSYLVKWVRAGLEDRKAADQAKQDTLKQITG